MNPVTGYHFIGPDDLHWRPSNLMRIPNADFLERTGSENLSARLWRLPPGSASTRHKHLRQEEFYFVLEGVGRIRVGGETLTVPKHAGVLVGPEQLRQVFNDTDSETLWLIVGAPEELELLQGANSPIDLSLIYPEDPKQLPPNSRESSGRRKASPSLPSPDPLREEAVCRIVDRSLQSAHVAVRWTSDSKGSDCLQSPEVG